MGILNAAAAVGEPLASLPPRARQRVAGFLLRWGHYAEARPLLECLAWEQPDGILYRAWLGQCYLGLGLLDEAAGIIEPLAREHADSILARLAHVDLLIARGNLRRAFDACQDLFRPPLGRPVLAWEKLASYHLAAGEPAQALACCLRSGALRTEGAPEGEAPEPPGPFLRLLARVQSAAGNEDVARGLWEEHARREGEDAAILRSALVAEGIALSLPLGQAAAAAPPREATPASRVPPSDPGAPADALRPLLHDVFGYADFLPGQRECIGRVLARQDVLAVLPTGGGKSLCYQLAALHLPGTVVVISPLIALMRDQVERLPPALARGAAVINSTIRSDVLRARTRQLASCQLRLVYAAPERLRQWPFVHALQRARVSLFVVDEAHCISLWGHDFRPDYLCIGPVLEHLGNPPVLALTATATPRVATEIGTGLGRSLCRVSAGIARPNLRLEVRRCTGDDEKLRYLFELVLGEGGPAIVYARSRQATEELADALRQRGVSAVHYHAGMEPCEREEAQAAFMGGRARVVCATIAFGMGIDKPDIRLIVHHNLPASVEAYWQEAGRAGRDGLPARCVLLATDRDGAQAERLAARGAVTLQLLEAVRTALPDILGGSGPGRLVLDDLARAVGEGDDTRLRAALGLLQRSGLLQRFPDLPWTFTLRARRPGDAAFAAFLTRARIRVGQPLSLETPQLCTRAAMSPADIEQQLLEWQDAGWLDVRSSGYHAFVAAPPAPAGAADRIAGLLAEHAASQRGRVRRIRGYAAARSCRHALIAAVFGEKASVPCGACDVCAPGPRPAARVPAPSIPSQAPSAARPPLPPPADCPAIPAPPPPEHRPAAAPSPARRVASAPGPALSAPVDSTPTSDGQGGSDGDAEYRKLLERLRGWCRSTARERRLASYCVFPNSVLRGIARRRPHTRAELVAIRGIGDRLADRYGEAVLAIIREEPGAPDRSLPGDAAG